MSKKRTYYVVWGRKRSIDWGFPGQVPYNLGRRMELEGENLVRNLHQQLLTRRSNMSTFVELTEQPDWRSAKAIAFDLDTKALVGASVRLRKRVFFPISQTREKAGTFYASEWIINKKIEELVAEGFGQGASMAISFLLGSDEIVEGAPPGIDFSNLREFFDKAAENLGTPKVQFGEVKLNRSGNQAKVPGVVHVTNGLGWGDPARQWYGSIQRDGSFRPTRDCTDEVMDLLVKFNADPSGNCCFCFKTLTQERSRTIGYGPTCAKNYGLAW